MHNHQHNVVKDDAHCGCSHSHDHCQTDTQAQAHDHEHDHDHAGHQHDEPEEEDERTEPLPVSGSQRFSWRINGMDCPSCARKIENAVTSIAGVEQAKVLFATEKLVIDARQDVSTQVINAVTQIGFTLVLPKPQQGAAAAPSATAERLRTYGPIAILALLMLISWGLETVNPAAGRIAFIATTLFGLAPIMRKAWRLIRSGTPFAIETLMSVAALGALFIGATAEAAMVLLLFMLGELLESYAANRARKGISALMALVPEEALVISGNTRRLMPISDLRPGDIIEVAPGARLPADAELLSEGASFDESALTGESIPVERLSGEKIAAGSLSVDRVTQLRVVSQPGNNAIDRILQLIEEAEERRAPIERFLDRFSRIYTPAIMLLSVAVILVPPLLFAQPWETWIYRGLTLLLIGCPCALVISTPAAITSGLAAATRRGALIKGGAALEQLGVIRTIAFDKTGTLTEGKPMVTDLFSANNDDRALLARAAAVEEGSHHPLARAIVDHAKQHTIPVLLATQRQALAGSGVQGEVAGKSVLISAPSKLSAGLLDGDWLQRIDLLEQAGKTVVVVLENQQPIGLIALRDTLRNDAKVALADLQALGIQGVMLTGDNPRAAAAIAAELNIDYRAGLLPVDKVTAITELSRQHPTAMVGDGINDAPAMKAASIGIAMGSGTDVALETADAALTHNRLQGLADMIRLSRATRANIRQNITIAIGLKGVFLVTTLFGLTGLWIAVLADTGATALVTANALRLLRKR